MENKGILKVDLLDERRYHEGEVVIAAGTVVNVGEQEDADSVWVSTLDLSATYLVPVDDVQYL